MNAAGCAIAHALPGRVRLRIPRVKQEPELGQRLERELRRVSGIDQVEANALTGSVLITFDESRIRNLESLQALAAVVQSTLPELDLERDDLSELMTSFTQARNGTAPSAAGDGWPSWSETIEQAQSTVHGWFTNVRMETAVPVALLALGIRDWLSAETHRMPGWYEFFWYAFSTYYILNRPQDPRTSG